MSSHPTKVLILGSGELGKELALEAHKLGVEVVAVDRYDNAPAMHLAHRKYVVEMLNGNAIKEIIRRENPEAIIPEVESIDVEVLRELESEGFLIIPNAEAVRICMNRIRLRELIAKTLGLPTTKYFIAEDYVDVINA
ncbi:MAG: phosphoribosylglycinamide formyltransferase 2, partial [Sulfolobales archaeon]